MTNINQTFHPTRFGSYLRKLLGENRRNFYLYCILAFGLALLVAFITAISHLWDAKYIWDAHQGATIPTETLLNDYSYHSYHSLLYSWLMIVVCAVVIIAASLMFSRCASKQGRLRDLLCPASQFEKFTASFLIYIIGAWLLAISSAYFATWLSQLTMRIFTPYDAFYSSLEDTLNDNSAESWADNTHLMLLAIFIFLQSFFALGSCIWPKNSYVKTFGAGFTLFIIYSFIAAGLINIIQSHYETNMVRYAKWIDSPGTYTIIATFMTVVNYTITYCRYRELDVNDKW